MSKITNIQKFKMIDRELKFMKKMHPKWIAGGTLQKNFSDHKIEVFEAIRLDYLKLSGEKVREYERRTHA